MTFLRIPSWWRPWGPIYEPTFSKIKLWMILALELTFFKSPWRHLWRRQTEGRTGAGLEQGSSFQHWGLLSSKSSIFSSGKMLFKEILNLCHRGTIHVLLQNSDKYLCLRAISPSHPPSTKQEEALSHLKTQLPSFTQKLMRSTKVGSFHWQIFPL